MQQNEVYAQGQISRREFSLYKYPRSQRFKENSKNLHVGRFFKSPSGVGMQFSSPTSLCLLHWINKNYMYTYLLACKVEMWDYFLCS